MAQVTRVVVGVILRPHGVKGFVKVMPTTDDPNRFRDLSEVELFKDEESLGSYRMERMELQPRYVLVKFRGLDTPEAAEPLRGADLTLPREACLPLEDDQFYQFDLIDAEVYTTAGRRLGKVAEIMSCPANDVWVVRDEDDREWLLPAIRSVIKNVDLDRQRIEIEPLEGLLEE